MRVEKGLRGSQKVTIDMQKMEQKLTDNYRTMSVQLSLQKGETFLYIFDGLTEKVTRKEMINVATGIIHTRIRSYIDPFTQVYVKYKGQWHGYNGLFSPISEKLVPREIIAQSLLFD